MGLRTNLPPNQPDADDERNKVGVNPPNQQAMQQVQPQGVQSSPKPTTQQPSASAQPQSPQLTPGAGLQPRPGTGPTQAKGTGFVGARQYAQAGSGGQRLAGAVAGRISGAASGGAEQLQKAREQFQSGIGQVQSDIELSRGALQRFLNQPVESGKQQVAYSSQPQTEKTSENPDLALLSKAYSGLEYRGPQGLSAEEAQRSATEAANLASLTGTTGGRATLLGGIAGRRASGYGAGLRALDVGLLGQAGVTPELAKARSEALGLGSQIGREQEIAKQQIELAKGGLSKLKEDVKGQVSKEEKEIDEALEAQRSTAQTAEDTRKTQEETARTTLGKIGETGDLSQLEKFIDESGLYSGQGLRGDSVTNQIKDQALSTFTVPAQNFASDQIARAQKEGDDSIRELARNVGMRDYDKAELSNAFLNDLRKRIASRTMTQLSEKMNNPEAYERKQTMGDPLAAFDVKGALAKKTKDYSELLTKSLTSKAAKNITKEGFLTPQQIARKKALARIAGTQFVEPKEKFEAGTFAGSAPSTQRLITV